MAAVVRRIIDAPELLLTDGRAPALVAFEYCLSRLRRVRMGGRSAPLVAASVIAWRVPLGWLTVDMEETAGLALGVAADPSFVWPEWGTILTGVLVVRLGQDSSLRPNHSFNERSELLSQIRHRLKHLAQYSPPTPTLLVSAVSKSLLAECVADLEET